MVSQVEGSALWEIIALTIRVTGTALAASAVLGIPTGALLAFTRFPGRRLLVALVYTGMGLPPVVVGLVVYLLLSRSGPGRLGWSHPDRDDLVRPSSPRW
jgi:tungstate transport system permease protein